MKDYSSLLLMKREKYRQVLMDDTPLKLFFFFERIGVDDENAVKK